MTVSSLSEPAEAWRASREVSVGASADVHRAVTHGSKLAVPEDSDAHPPEATRSGLAMWPRELVTGVLVALPTHIQSGSVCND